MSSVAFFPWACPECGAEAMKHGAGGKEKCKERREGNCSGFLCDCTGDVADMHGNTLEDPCPEARCYHCGWGGEFPRKPKGLLAWEKKALEAGWVPPDARAKELGLWIKERKEKS